MATPSKDNGAPPTYEDTVSSGPDFGGASHGQQIIDQLTTVRARHIRSVLDEHIYPRLKQQATYGIAKTTIAMMPSDVLGSSSSLDSPSNVLEMIGFPSDEVVQQLQLGGPLNRGEFWQQTGVIGDLERALRDRLATTPFTGTIDKPQTPTIQPESPRATSQRRGFFGRKSVKPETLVSHSTAVPTGTPSQLKALVSLEEVCFRTVSDFGLFETVSRPAIVIRVSMGL
ncbi:uncharacterized protein K452DRAFT_354823 [Aplosporella prunicola CBS 121167]|uniref:Uncharacterized protein n=1 Tax=Aplosporella prunicola CBS 121167 TaxID=1176127 RepID=A0A6A6BTH7_9PEZI|nr:uncharacterized protein K452DRAFT_354823 [Aplosporella prunicola CBS 121167]KAF2147429.1 hypothetical protein K452DRAFT_354823 [Aplosporella prunicola CBS 121167]